MDNVPKRTGTPKELQRKTSPLFQKRPSGTGMLKSPTNNRPEIDRVRLTRSVEKLDRRYDSPFWLKDRSTERMGRWLAAVEGEFFKPTRYGTVLPESAVQTKKRVEKRAKFKPSSQTRRKRESVFSKKEGQRDSQNTRAFVRTGRMEVVKKKAAPRRPGTRKGPMPASVT